MNHAAKRQHGFTLIELMLAMTFIAALLLAIAMTIIQVGGIYNKGMTLKEVNQASREVGDDFKRTVASGKVIVIDRDYVPIMVAGDMVGGRLCLGTYSYVWNYTKLLQSGGSGKITYENIASTPENESLKDIRLLKISDKQGNYCKKNVAGNLLMTFVAAADQPEARELLKPGDHDLGLHQFELVTPVPASASDDKTDQQLLTLNYTIGTSVISALNPTQTACLGTNEPNADPLYCNVQQFTLVVRSGSKV